MKKSIILLIGILVAVTTLYANDKYTEAMQKGMDQLTEARTPESFLEASNTFSRIASVEKDKWIPAYYAAYTLTMYGAMNNDVKLKDEYLNRAEDFLKKASAIEEENVEIMALQGFIYLIRISVDPQSRGPEFSGKSGAILARARSIDPQNPRVMHMSAQLSYGTAQFFGQDGSEACKTNAQAIALFDSFSSDIPFYPTWGKNMALGFQERCK
ncbi:hypothetical protein [Fulvivirga sedimenti]|uniref:Uncharacterized protein n=1 Tax=Fulvivirga sedimenti TaxID=2879465 RepID=A0A9X1HNX0_9BACT|nr:hypothetical protein [Fulvivirga sedimenti]MCA6074273.1 hypothetical protein [Fulvivirga sedimenti]